MDSAAYRNLCGQTIENIEVWEQELDFRNLGAIKLLTNKNIAVYNGRNVRKFVIEKNNNNKKFKKKIFL